MGRKNALAGLWWGGGKGVISADDPLSFSLDEREGLLESYGRLITSLRLGLWFGLGSLRHVHNPHALTLTLNVRVRFRVRFRARVRVRVRVRVSSST